MAPPTPFFGRRKGSMMDEANEINCKSPSQSLSHAGGTLLKSKIHSPMWFRLLRRSSSGLTK